MTQTNTDLNQILTQLTKQNRKNRKHILRIEIARATDRSVKRALQEILEDLEKQERRYRLIIAASIFISIILILYILGVKSTMLSSDNDAQATQKHDKVVHKKPKELSLSAEEVKEWVEAVWDKTYQHVPSLLNYIMQVSVDSNDQLVYIEVMPPAGVEIDRYGYFRINEKGELQKWHYLSQSPGENKWETISTSFMDVSEVEPAKNVMNTTQLNAEQAINWIKKMRESRGLEHNKITYLTQLSDEGLLYVLLYTSSEIHSEKVLSEIYRINASGFLEQADVENIADWHVISVSYEK